MVFAVAGCETLHNAGVPGFEQYIKKSPEEAAATEKHRSEFLQTRSHKALYWLMANCISNGMMLNEVEAVLGEPGERETDTNRFKSDGLTQSTDLAYKWGPDTLGHTVILFFRDGRLCNFNPKDFKGS
jgi:hypothetical protein